jgi:hypothetical protein
LDEDQENDSGISLDLNLNDGDILDLIKKPYRESETYWESDFGLAAVRKENKNLWLPKHWSGRNHYEYQEQSLYEDPRIFMSTETVVSIVNARVPTLEVMPAQSTVVSLQLAKDIAKVGEAYVRRYEVMDLFRLQVRSFLLKRISYIKLYFDENKGDNGEIVSEHVPGEDVIVDKDARYGEVPRFMAHKIRNKTVEELLLDFPEAEQKILKAIGASRVDRKGNLVMYKTFMGKKLSLLEVWFKYIEKGKTKSGVALVDRDFQNVFNKMPNPNWNYEEEEGRVGNLLDDPEPPFIPINHLNDGTSYIDQTTLIEQAASMQKIINKHGFQIIENADQSGSGLIFNTEMIKKSDIAKLTGSPDERIGVKGNVRDAVTRVQPPPLPNYIIDSVRDARNEIDNIFATHDVSRGEKSQNVTLGQDMMQQNQDITRMDDIARAVEKMSSRYFRYLFQMMKVFYTEEHYFKAVGEDGQFDFIVMHSDLIEDGIDISVTAGSTMPINKATQQAWIDTLLSAGLLDPLTVYEVAAGGNLPSPQKMLERYLLFKTDPYAFMAKAKEDDFNREAFQDIQILISGKGMPEIRDEYGPEYLKFMNNYMLGGDYEKQVDLVKQMFIEHMRIVGEIAQKQMMKAMTQMPTEDEMEAQNRKTAEQNAMDAQNPGEVAAGGEPGGDPKQSRADTTKAALESRKGGSDVEPGAETPMV